MSSVLIVDDEIDITESLASLFEMESFTVESLHDGRSGWNRLKEQPFDLVVLDIMMPGMSGLEVLSKIREDSRLRDQPVLLMSAINPVLGSDDRTLFLKKPFEIDTFLNAVHTLVDPESPSHSART